MKKEYLTPEILVTYVDSDIITLSGGDAEEAWWGKEIEINTPTREN